MKKIALSLMMIAAFAGTATAKTGKTAKHKSVQGVCTPKGCPAGLVDHSLDAALTANWNPNMATVTYGTYQGWTRTNAPDTYYSFSLPNYTVTDQYRTGVTRPSAYDGQDAPSYDGAAKNAYRNINYNRSDVNLPASDGSK